MGNIDEDELIGIVQDPADDRDNYKGGKKKNKGDKGDDKDTAKVFRAYYEGLTLERIKTGPGESLSWQRCGRSKLPFGQEALVALVKKHRKETRAKTAGADFKRLSSDKQRIINRIIEEKQLDETSKTAEWTLVDVQQIQRPTGFMSSETLKLQVVIKRTDKGSDKNGTANPGTHTYAASDVIDLNVPLKKKDKSNKKGNKNSNSPNRMDPDDNQMNYVNGPMDPPPNHPPPQEIYPGDPFAGQPMPPPPQAPMPPPPQQQQPHPFNPYDPHLVDPYVNQPGSARDFPNPNPFQPQPNVMVPGQFDQPQQQYPHPHHPLNSRSRTPSRPRRPSHSHSRPRHYRRSDSPVEELTGKMDRMWSPHGSSRDSNSDDRSVFSREDYRRGHSPDTSVSSYDQYDRHGKRYRADSGPRARYRSKNYRDADIEPGYTRTRRYGGDRHYSRDRDVFERRPQLQRAITYADDYPEGGGMERPRYLPPAEGMQRRYTATPEVFGDRRREYFADREREREQELFDAGVRFGRGKSYYP